MYEFLESLSPRVEVSANIIFENRTYFIVLRDPNDLLFQKALKSGPLSRHVSWHHGNAIAELRVENFIGKLRVFDKEYEVTSSKYGAGLCGSEQVALITSELDDISKRISFSYDSAVYAKAQTDWNQVEESSLYRFNYLYQHFFSESSIRNVKLFFSQIKRDPASSYHTEPQLQHAWSVREVTPAYLRGLMHSGVMHEGGESGKPKKLLVSKKVLTKNNRENQFVRFFFEYCSHVSLQVINDKSLSSESVRQKANELLQECRTVLSDPFFEGISSSGNTSAYSTILARRGGYKDIFQLYITSLFSLKHMHEDFMADSHSGLVDIANLYEIWCFYRVASSVLGQHIFVTERSSYIKQGAIRYSTTFENDFYAVSYNKSFSTLNEGSYSLTLRPDISILAKARGDFFHFDAKYRVAKNPFSTQPDSSTFKAVDVHKMHAYLDAIYNSKSAVVLYPGDDYKFFVRGSPPMASDNITKPHVLEGVGALPLVPGERNEPFEEFIGLFFPPAGASPAR